MEVIANPIVIVILQYVCIPNHDIVYLKVTQNYMSVISQESWKRGNVTKVFVLILKKTKTNPKSTAQILAITTLKGVSFTFSLQQRSKSIQKLLPNQTRTEWFFLPVEAEILKAKLFFSRVE